MSLKDLINCLKDKEEKFNPKAKVRLSDGIHDFDILSIYDSCDKKVIWIGYHKKN